MILTSHTNTERFFLGNVLRARLKELLNEDTAAVDNKCEWDVVVSSEDRDPVVIV